MSSSFNSSIPRTVDPNLSMTSHDQKLALDKAFDDAFGPINDLGSPGANGHEPPEAKKPATSWDDQPPKEAAEPKEAPPPAETPPKTDEPKEAPEPEPKTTEPKPAEAPVVAKEEPHPDDEPDEELDKLRLHPDSRPETIETFRRLRGMVKSSNRSAKELRERHDTLTKELTTLRNTVRPVNDPSVQKELEDLRQFRTKHQVFDDSAYHVQYEQPVRDLFSDIIKDVKSLATDQAAGENWEGQMRAAGPDGIERKYWNEGVIDQCADPLHRERLIKKISGLLEAQDKRNQFREQMANEPEAYEKYRNQQAADYWQGFSQEAEDECKKIIPTLGEWAVPKDPALAKTNTERAAFEAHNKIYKEYEDLFQRVLTEVATQGPRGMTRVSLQAVMAEKYKRDNEGLSSQVTKLKAELKAAQDELNKIAGARAKVNQSTGTSVRSSPEVPQPKLGESVDVAFKRAFG